jgi:hypothetical protein
VIGDLWFSYLIFPSVIHSITYLGIFQICGIILDLKGISIYLCCWRSPDAIMVNRFIVPRYAQIYLVQIPDVRDSQGLLHSTILIGVSTNYIRKLV